MVVQPLDKAGEQTKQIFFQIDTEVLAIEVKFAGEFEKNLIY